MIYTPGGVEVVKGSVRGWGAWRAVRSEVHSGRIAWIEMGDDLWKVTRWTHVLGRPRLWFKVERYEMGRLSRSSVADLELMLAGC